MDVSFIVEEVKLLCNHFSKNLAEMYLYVILFYDCHRKTNRYRKERQRQRIKTKLTASEKNISQFTQFIQKEEE